MRKVSCGVCGIYKWFADDADIPDIEEHDFIIWGINEDSTYFACCLKCMNHEEKEKEKKYKINDKRRLKLTDTLLPEPKIMYREI